MKRDGSGQRKILGSGFGATFFQPRWSPAGDRLTYVHPQSTNVGLWVMKRGGSHRHEIFKDGWEYQDW